MKITDYFEMYLTTRISYDRLYHIKNCGFDLSKIDSTMIKKLFIYIDSVVFGEKIMEYVKSEKIDLFFKVSNSMKSTAGMFVRSANGKKMGFKISKTFFQNIVDNNIVNIDIGTVDHTNKNHLSVHYAEPLFTTMEHEIIHMLMYITRDHAKNDSHTMKSGHTAMFKRLVFNIFGHRRITHNLKLGDTTENLNNMREIGYGDYVKIKDKDISGYVVDKKDRGAIIYVTDYNSKKRYEGVYYKELIRSYEKQPIDIQSLINKLQKGKCFTYSGDRFEVVNIYKRSVSAKLVSKNSKLGKMGGVWNVPLGKILEFEFNC